MEIINRCGCKFLSDKSLLEKGVINGFSLRCGGVSDGDFASLNVGTRRGDNVQKAEENIKIAAVALGLHYENLTRTYQTHTNNVAFVEGKDIGREMPEGTDGIVTDAANVPLMCYCADCVPILLYEKKHNLIGAVHSGWRGTAGNIVQNAVRLMEEHGGKAEFVTALIGPAIGICCYEVSNDVGEVFARDYPSCVIKKANGKYMLDLKKIVALQLEGAGVAWENVTNSGICTSCENESFFSHRAQRGRSGLLGGFIEISRE